MNDAERKAGAAHIGVNGFFDPLEIKGLSAKSARAFSSGRMARLMRAVSRLCAFTGARVYGLVFLSFGILTLFLHLAEYYFMNDSEVGLSSLLIGVIFSLISIFFLISDEPICIALQRFRIIDFLIFDLFSINRMQKNDGSRGFGASVGIIIGFALSIFGFFFPTEYAVLIIVGFIFVSVALVSPEFSYILSLLIFPYLTLIPYSRYVLSAIVIVTLISFVRKVLVGKRVYSFEIYDLALLFLILSVAVTGIILGGEAATEPALFTVIFVLGYIPASNLAVNRRLCDCASAALTASAIPLSVYSVVRYGVKIILGEREAESAFFDSSETLAVYLCAVIIFSLYLAVKRTRRALKCYHAAVSALSFLALLTTECFLVIPTLAVVLCTLTVLRLKRASLLLVIPILFLPFCIFFLSESALLWLSEAFNIAPDLSLRGLYGWESVRYFGDNAFLGMGSGASCDGFDIGYNLYAAMICRFGVLMGIAFVILLVLRAVHIDVFKKYYSDSSVNFYVNMCTLASVCMLSFGAFLDLFGESEMIYLFVVIFGIGSAALRLSKKEREENLIYYKDLGRSDSADIDVVIKR